MTPKEKLNIEYATLSALQDLFPKNSIHKAAAYIDKRMHQIIKEIDKEDTGIVEPLLISNPYPDELHDSDGYPTEAALLYLQNWWFGYKDGVLYKGEFCDVTKANIIALVTYLNKLWHFAKWGFIYDKSLKKLELHTGGWSGNEEIIPYLEMTWFHKVYWSMSKTGGHYYYEWK